MNIKEKIREFILNELKGFNEGENIEDINDETNLIEQGIIDSMMILSLLAFLEENYGIILRKDELKPENFTTLGKINELVIQKIKM
jgi:acyl carrier protein